MNPSDTSAPQTSVKRRGLSARRIALLATTIAGLGVAALVVAPGLNLQATYPAATAQNLSRAGRQGCRLRSALPTSSRR